MLATDLADYLVRKGVSVNCVLPAPFDVDTTSDSLPGDAPYLGTRSRSRRVAQVRIVRPYAAGLQVTKRQVRR